MSKPNGYCKLVDAKTITGADTAVDFPVGTKTYQASGATTAGAGSATIEVQGSLDNSNFDVIGTITLTLGTASTSDSFTSDDRYKYLRGEVTAISGTGAAVSLIVGY